MTDDRTPDEDQILKVSDLAPARRKIEFSTGATGEVASPLEFGVADRAKYDRLRNDFDRLQKKDKLTANQTDELEKVGDKLARIALPEITDDEFEALTLIDKETAISFLVVSFSNTMRNLGTAVGEAMGIPKDIPIPQLEELTSES